MFENFISKWLLSSTVCYMTPTAAIAAMLLFQRRGSATVKVLHFSGVLIHEVLHFIVGLLFMARPTSISLIPRSEGGRLILGSVVFVGLTWFNAWATALAPLLAVPIILCLVRWRLGAGPQHLQFWDVLIWLLVAPQLLHCWPSRADWKLVLLSWPLAVLIGMIFVVWTWAGG